MSNVQLTPDAAGQSEGTQPDVDASSGDFVEIQSSQSGRKSSFKLGKENINTASKNSLGGSSNKVGSLANLVDKPQRVGGYPLKDKKLTQKAIESKSQNVKKKALGDSSGNADLHSKLSI